MGSEKITSILYQGNACMGAMSIYPQYKDASLMGMISKEIHISHLSCPGKRCPPLVVLHSIASNGVYLKMEPKEQQPHHDHSSLNSLYSACLQEAKTAIVPLGENELHLVAMSSADRQDQVPCFWGFIVAAGLYASCLRMLNLKCLAVVFDLDETLIVANTIRSFKDHIELLEWQILGEVDARRVAGISAEIKRYQVDQKVLKQFAETDRIYHKGKLMKARSEIVPAISENQQPLVRPVIRLCEHNIILTRIDPNNRDSSVFVRMRPAWEELRNYLTANGRKRFEVFVCTMSEKDYALEMWRLLDPETTLISPKELHGRVVCVKPCFRKSLINVFHNGICHPKMAMVIDDRLNVWEDTDQSQVHVVPAFAPYHAPLAETSKPNSILRITKEVVFSVRVGFFEDFDKDLLERMACVFYETDVIKLPVVPDVGKYMVTEKNAIANDNTKLSVQHGMANSKVDEKLHLQDQNLLLNTGTSCVLKDNQEPKSCMQSLQQPQMIFTAPSNAPTQLCEKALKNSNEILPVVSSNPQLIGSEPSNKGTPGTGEENIHESETDLNTRTRLLVLNHGQDSGEHDFKSCEPPLLLDDFSSPSGNHTKKQSKCIDPRVNQFTKKANNENNQNQSSRETKRSTSAQATIVKQRTDNRKGSDNPVDALKKLCTKEGLNCQFQWQPSNGVLNSGDSHVQVVIAEKIFGKSSGPTWEAAKVQAAEEALKNLELNLSNAPSQKRSNPAQIAPDQPNKKSHLKDAAIEVDAIST